jgi:hypothetical protein
MQSPTINKLAEALAKVQAELKPVPRNAENPFFKSSYADLSACIRHAAPLLAKHGLAVIQTGAESKEMEVAIRTTLVHSSGEWIDGVMAARPGKYDPQGSGSAVTYLRRYGYNAIVGLVQEGEDDDGNDATQSKPADARPPAAKPAPKAVPAKPVKTEKPGDFERIVDGVITGDFVLKDYKTISSKPGASKQWSGWEVILMSDDGFTITAGTLDRKLGDKLDTLKGSVVTVSYQPGAKAGMFKLLALDPDEKGITP